MMYAMDATLRPRDRRLRTGSLFFSLGTAFLVVLFISSVHDYSYFRWHEIKPLYFQLLAVGLAGVALVTHANIVANGFPKALLAWIGLYLGLQLVSFLVSTQTEASVGQLIFALKSAALLFSFVVLLLLEPESKWISRIVVVVAILSVAINIYDFLVPTFSTTPGRAAGLYQNSNISGRIITMSMVLSCLAIPKHLRPVYCLIVGIGVLLTFSRSSWLLWAIGITGLAATGQVFLKSKVASAFVFGSVGLLVVFALLSGIMLDIFQAIGVDQYLTGGTTARLGGGAGTFSDASAAGRIDAIWYSLSEFRQHPWFGAGLGATTDWITLNRPHNMYLMLAVESGIVGLLVFLLLIGILWLHSNSIGRVAVVLYAVSSFFSHTNLEQPAILCLMAMVAVFYPRKAESATFLQDQSPPQRSKARL